MKIRLRLKNFINNNGSLKSPAFILVVSVFVTIIIYFVWSIQNKLVVQIHGSQLMKTERIELFLLGLLQIGLGTAAIMFIFHTIKINRIIFFERTKYQSSRDELLSLASHQLRTPATAVKQYIGMMIEGYAGALTKEQMQILEKAYKSNERQIVTINQILYVTKASSGKLQLNMSHFNLNLLIEEIISDLSSVIKSRRQKLSFEPKYINTMICADKHFLRMVIENLISNASKYTHKSGKIEIKTNKKDGTVILSVKDNGVGIDLEDRDKLFKKFTRIDNELSIEAGGSGIGLYLDKILVDMHHGQIVVNSKLKKGTTFKVFLPINPSKAKIFEAAG